MEKVTNIMSEVLELIDAGFSSKAAQKEALSLVSKGYQIVRDGFLEQFHGTGSGLFWDVPIDLHHATPKKLAKLASVQGFEHFECWTSQLRDLREAVKAAPVVKQPPKSEKVAAEKVQQSLEEILVELDRMVEVGSLFNGLPISATPHMVCRDGRWYRRTFFYWNGKLTPLSMIIAAAEAIKAKTA